MRRDSAPFPQVEVTAGTFLDRVDLERLEIASRLADDLRSLRFPTAGDPERPPNSPRSVYQIESSTFVLLRTFETAAWRSNLAGYLQSMKGINRLRDKARHLSHIPVTLPNGQSIELTAGGQNVLVKKIVEQFAPRFTPRGHVIYIGDAGEKHLFYEVEYLRGLGVEIDRHGKIPDVVIHDVERNWLILIEAVTSHGPVNILRHNQLTDLFGASRAGLVFVTTFLDRASMREYLPEIAWETEVWVADAPDHAAYLAASPPRCAASPMKRSPVITASRRSRSRAIAAAPTRLVAGGEDSRRGPPPGTARLAPTGAHHRPARQDEPEGRGRGTCGS